MQKLGILYTTTFPKGQKNEEVRNLRFIPDTGVEKQTVNLHPQVKYQQWEGFGGAFTDSAGYMFSQMSEETKQKLIDAYYGDDGIGYTLGRMHLDSSDFSLEHYEAIADEKDREMRTFSLRRTQKYIIPLVDAAQKVFGGNIPMLAAPWSPPAFMKTNGERNNGGKLRDEYREFYAEYLCKYISELRKENVNITGLSIQNEQNAIQRWDSCLYTAEEEKRFIRDYLYPALKKTGLDEVGIFIWDHNKERVFERACAVIEGELEEIVKGIAFHWYSGDHFEDLAMVSRRFPDKKLVQSEACIEFSLFSPDDFLANAQKYAHDIIGDMNHGMTAFYDWNLVLDENGGPNHAGNFCDAPWFYHADSGKLEERASYAYIGHFSKYIRPGARRIACSRYCDAVEVTAFENADGSIVCVFLNQTEKALPVYLRLEGSISEFELKESSIATFIISACP